MDDAGGPWARLVLVVGGGEHPLGPVGPLPPCDLRLVDDLLRLHLAVRRHGASLRLVEVHPELRDLLRLVGLAAGLGVDPVQRPSSPAF